MSGKIFVISGPSGSGKTTLLETLLKDKALKKKAAKSISLATRPKRSGEKNGEAYFFITKEEFKQRLKAQKILEWTRYLGYYYATPRDFAEKQLKKGRHLILCLDLKGALKIKRLYPDNTITVFILPPSIKTLKERIEGRCNKTKKEEIRQRLRLAQSEIREAGRYDYSIVNKTLTESVKQLGKIIKGVV